MIFILIIIDIMQKYSVTVHSNLDKIFNFV